MEPILVEIKQDIPGFDGFIGSWVLKGDTNLIVDVGPANSVTRLVESLRNMDLDRVDLVLLTHIHIDHAGGLAQFLEHFRMAKVICHTKAIKHLVDPSKLWEGSRKVLGDIADSYGPIRAVDPKRLIPHTEINLDHLEIIETPGHAPHHLSFVHKGHLFAGEASGNYLTVKNKDYLRPATPPIFFLEAFMKSLERLLKVDSQPIYYAHFGRADDSHLLVNRYRDQLLRWRDLIQNEMNLGEEGLIERCVDSLLKSDPDLSAFEDFSPEIQQREKFFMANSIRGYVGYLQGR